MFTFKKIALVGVAALTALSMSCSDSDGDDAGGKWDTAFKVTDGATIDLSGVIKANDDDAVTEVSITAGGNAATLSNAAFLIGPSVDLIGTTVSGVCGSTTGIKEFEFVITVTFLKGDKLTGKDKVSIDCGGGTELGEGEFELSYSGKSYFDADNMTLYSKTEAEARADSIDLVAYATSDATNDIYSGYAFFSSNEYATAKVYNFTGSAKDVAQSIWDEEVDAPEHAGQIAISNGKTFILESSDFDYFKVTIIAVGDQSVTIKVEQLDINY
jgi:hypothetical protein